MTCIYDRMDKKDIDEFAESILLSEMFGVSNKSQAHILAIECIVRKMPPMVLAERYNIIFGRLSMKADAMLADFRTKLGGTHKVVANTPDRASVKFILNGEEKAFTLTWEEAKGETFPYSGKESSIVEKHVSKAQRKSIICFLDCKLGSHGCPRLRQLV